MCKVIKIRFSSAKFSFLSRLRWGDWLLSLILGLGAFWVWQQNSRSEQNRLFAEISRDGQRLLYALEEQRSIVLRNDEGKQVMRIEIQGEQIWVAESDCPLQYCVLRGPIQNIGQWIACLPNRVFIRVLSVAGKGDAPFSLDAEVF